MFEQYNRTKYCKPTLTCDNFFFFCERPEINRFEATNIHFQTLSTPCCYFTHNAITELFAERNIHNKEAIANLAKFFHTPIKVGLQFKVEVN